MIFVVDQYCLIGLYTFLLILSSINIWTILIRQKRYKTLPLLVFYIFTFFGIALRLVFVIIQHTHYYYLKNYVNDFYLAAKLSVGLIQCWMILEIALRVRKAFKISQAEKVDLVSFEKRVSCGQYSAITFSFMIVPVVFIDDYFTLEDRSEERAKIKAEAWAFSYLTMFFLMAAVNILLLYVMR